MTKSEALSLEQKVGGLFYAAFRESQEEVTVAMALNGRFKAMFDMDHYFNIHLNSMTVEWFKYNGHYDLFTTYVHKIIDLVKLHMDDIKKLIWSYENRTKLTDDSSSRWIKVEETIDGDITYNCPNCAGKFIILYGTPEENNYNFCPRCGKDMRGEK